MLSIALTKGRLEKKSVEIFKKCDYGVELLENKGRQLVFPDSKKDYQYFLTKSMDCVTYVSHGVADVGIVGSDTLAECDNNYYEVLDLNVGKCSFVLAGLKDHNPFDVVGHLVIGSKYPTVTKQYFVSKKMDVEIIKIEGSVEISPILGLCDAIVDIMETGTTLKENGLVVYDQFLDISARLIVNKASFKLKKDEITSFIEDIEKVIGE